MPLPAAKPGQTPEVSSEIGQYIFVTETIRMWLRKHRRAAVFDGTPLPNTPPLTYHDARAWRFNNRDV